jgi:Subtilase family
MYGVFDSQFLPMKVAFAREGTDIDVAYTPNGEVDYLYRTGRLLAVDDPEVLARLERVLPGVRRTAEEERDAALPGLVILSIEEVEPGFLTVPQAMELIDEAFGGEEGGEGGEGGGKGDGPWESSARVTEEERWPVSPLHVMHLKDGRLCEATEPEVPCCGHRRKGGKGEGEPCPPCPPRAGNGGEGLLIGVCDTGLLAGLDLGQVPWLGGVTGDPDPLGPALPGGAPSIPKYTGHGTFVSGVARCEAPGAAVHVARLFMKDGGEFEHVIARRLWQIFAGDLTNGRVPALVNLSAGGYTRKNRPPLSFNAFFRHHPGVTLTAAAGNDSICRPFWPAASRHAIGVGALGADLRHRAWFSNFGDWVDVYAPGEALVNAFATGVYTYQEPPRRPAVQDFDGMARWSGTSFSAPLVAGLIAWQMTAASTPAADAASALLQQAVADEIQDVGPVLYPREP